MSYEFENLLIFIFLSKNIISNSYNSIKDYSRLISELGLCNVVDTLMISNVTS